MSSTMPAATTTGLTLAKAAPRWAYFAVFAISGFSGLIYESIWSHYLKLFLGHAAYAQSLVLIIFMGGLAIGSWLVAGLSPRWRSPLLWYAIVEGVIGVIALVFHKTFLSMSDTFYLSLLPNIHSVWLGDLLKWSSAAALILPQSILLGMTFPLMSSGLIRRYPEQPGGTLAMLYFTNSIGAAVGVLASGFWMIALVGLPGTILAAGLLNVAVALVVWVLTKLDPNPETRAVPVRPAKTTSNDGLALLFLAAAAITGASSFMYEVGWLRMLSLVLGSTTHSFEVMLSAFITGLAFGGLWIKRRIDRIDDAIRFSGLVQVLMGALAVLTLPLYVWTFDWMAAIWSGLQHNEPGYRLFTLLSHGIALSVMVPATFLAGMTLPLFTHVLMRDRDGERAIGRIYAANTFGAIAGVLVAMHVLMPFFGLKQLICIAAALDILLGVVLLARSAPARRTRTLVQGACFGVFAVVVMLSVPLEPKRLAAGVYRHGVPEFDAKTNVLFYRDGKTASISLISRGSVVSIATNGKPDASIEMNPARPPVIDEITMIMAGALPLAYQPHARRAANIGLGSGLTTHTLLGDPALEQVDTVEIEAQMITAAQGFGDRVSRTFADPRSVIHLEDAKAFFAQQKQLYDVIVAEPSNPWVSGVASLFSEEFYRSIGRYLSDDGVLVQWLQLYEFNDELVESVLKGLTTQFSDYAIYNTANANVLIVAKRSGRLPEPVFEGLFAGPLGAELARVGIKGPNDFLVRKVASKALLQPLLAAARVPANSDYFPFLDLNAGKARFENVTAGLFNSWTVAPLPLLDMLGVAKVRYDAVTPSDSFVRTQLIGVATRNLAALAVEAPDRAPTDLGDSTQMALLRTLRETCAAGLEQEWAEALHGLARDSLAYLDADAGSALLAAAVPRACHDRLSPDLRRWLDLYGAVAARDSRRMSEVGERLLEGSGAPAVKYYALVAAMAGRLAMSDFEQVARIYDRHQDIAGDLRSSPEIRLMLALANDGAVRKTTEVSHSLL